MHAVSGLTSAIPKIGWEHLPGRVCFGGTYRELWSEDYNLYIRYDGQQTVDAQWQDGCWHAAGGDSAWTALLNSPACPALSRQYFQASASASALIQSCLRRGLSLAQLHQLGPIPQNPLLAPELMRLLMDEHDFTIDAAYQMVAVCCDDLFASGVDVEQIYPLQPRTAHVISILRGCAARMITAAHDSSNPRYRIPQGAVPEGSPLRLRVNMLRGKAERAYLVLYGDSLHQEYQMEPDPIGFAVSLRVPEQAAALWYCFRLETDIGSHWLCPDESGYLGRLYGYEAGGFRLTVYRRDFETPAWFRRSVMYQIFPDRFAFSQDGTAEAGVAYHSRLGQTPELHRSLDEPVRYLPRPFERNYIPDDFYGGTLRGIREKLPYLQELGVSCLYLNPIVEARSNHRYDASDYRRVDPILGDEQDFRELCQEAERRGIRLILDGVFSHTGADSVYFNRLGHYPDKGACQGHDSPYYGWYDFRHFPDDYRCWWGFPELPEVEETNPSWQNFVVTGEDSVVRTWLRRGAAGWRLDVADELPDSVLALIRRAAKEEKPDALILGEVWEDAVLKESYGSRRVYALGSSLDSVMNYPLRTAVLDFLLDRSSAMTLRDFLLGQRMNYPAPLYYSLMNLLGSHDVERLRSALATDTNIRALKREEQLELVFTPEALERAVAREKLAAVLQFALPGVPCIYYGDEQGMCGVCDPFNRLPFREDRQDLHDWYAALARLRSGADALSTGAIQIAAWSADVLLILRYIRGGQDVFDLPARDGVYLAVINRGAAPADYELDGSAAGLAAITGHIEAGSAEIRKLS